MNGPCTVENPKQRSQYSGRGFRESLRLEVWRNTVLVRGVCWIGKCTKGYNLVMLLSKAIPILHRLSLKIDHSFNIP